MLEGKAKEITQLNEAIQSAEAELSQLQNDLMKEAQASEQFQQLQPSPHDDVNTDLLDELRARHQAEIERAEERHQREVDKLQRDIERSIQASESWCESHAEMVMLTKTAQLESLRRQLEEAKLASNRGSLSATQSRAKLFQQSKNATIMNSQRRQFLEAQIGEIAAVTRDELRDIKAKIDECLAAVDIREQDHCTEIARYELEVSEREQQYAAHLETAAQQFASEKQRLEKEVSAASAKAENMQRILKQLERQNDKQLQGILREIEKMKSMIYQSRSRDVDRENETRNYVATVNQLQRDCAQTEQELTLVETEMKELSEENRDLKMELQKLDRALYGTARR